jgi:hypothetical protein
MKVIMLLADFAQVLQGKLYIMGGGWSITNSPQVGPTAIAIKIEVPWNEANRKHNLKLELLDSDFHAVTVQTPESIQPIMISGDFEVGRPAGLMAGTPIDVPLAFPISPLPLAPAQRYIWKLTIDGDTNDNWQVAFSTRPAAQTAVV